MAPYSAQLALSLCQGKQLDKNRIASAKLLFKSFTFIWNSGLEFDCFLFDCALFCWTPRAVILILFVFDHLSTALLYIYFLELSTAVCNFFSLQWTTLSHFQPSYIKFNEFSQDWSIKTFKENYISIKECCYTKQIVGSYLRLQISLDLFWKDPFALEIWLNYLTLWDLTELWKCGNLLQSFSLFNHSKSNCQHSFKSMHHIIICVKLPKVLL